MAGKPCPSRQRIRDSEALSRRERGTRRRSAEDDVDDEVHELTERRGLNGGGGGERAGTVFCDEVRGLLEDASRLVEVAESGEFFLLRVVGTEKREDFAVLGAWASLEREGLEDVGTEREEVLPGEDFVAAVGLPVLEIVEDLEGDAEVTAIGSSTESSD